jgi:CBS domain-containing protein
MHVKDVMISAMGSVSADDTLRAAMEKMKALDLDPLPVAVEDGAVVGLLFEQDVRNRASEIGLATGSHRVREAMRTDVVCCFEDQELSAAIENIEGHVNHESARRVPVLNPERHLVGLVSLEDLRKHAGQHGEADEVLGVDVMRERDGYEKDPVDLMSDGSFPASDPLPPPSSLAPDRR